jgi:hypothetical protein
MNIYCCFKRREKETIKIKTGCFLKRLLRKSFLIAVILESLPSKKLKQKQPFDPLTGFNKHFIKFD